MPADTTDEQMRQMMQTLLAERFKLEAHWEKKEMPIFALVIGKDGFKLKPSDPKNDDSWRSERANKRQLGRNGSRPFNDIDR